MPASSLYDKLIQRNETRFLFNIPIDTAPHLLPNLRRTVWVSTTPEVRRPAPLAALSITTRPSKKELREGPSQGWYTIG